MPVKLMHAAILVSMGLNGALYLSWFLSSGPDRVGYWFIIYFAIFPALAMLGVLALALRSTLQLSWWLGIILLAYVGLLTLLLVMAGLWPGGILYNLPPNGVEIFHVILWAIACLGLVFAMRRRPVDS